VLKGANASDFVSSSTCGRSLAAGASCPNQVRFTPSVDGAEAATLTITDNPSGSTQTVNLTGTGIPDVILSWGASPSSGIVGYDVYRGDDLGRGEFDPTEFHAD